MKIAVCVKQSIDTEALITLGSDGEVSTEGAALIIDPYAEFAVEKAVQLKEQNGGEVILVTVGSQDEVPAIRHALSMGADRAILIDDEAIDTTNPQAKARVLAAVLTEEQPDIILGGYKSGDTSRAQTLPRVASIMGLPQVGWITGLEIEEMWRSLITSLPTALSKCQLGFQLCSLLSRDWLSRAIRPCAISCSRRKNRSTRKVLLRLASRLIRLALPSQKRT